MIVFAQWELLRLLKKNWHISKEGMPTSICCSHIRLQPGEERQYKASGEFPFLFQQKELESAELLNYIRMAVVVVSLCLGQQLTYLELSFRLLMLLRVLRLYWHAERCNLGVCFN